MKRSPLAALALLLALACAACNDDDPEPRFGPPESTSPAPTGTETTSEPPEPLGPEETVRAWVEAQNLALRTGETQDVRALGPKCSSCDDFIVPIEETYDAGGSYETAGWQIVSLKNQDLKANAADVSAAIKFARGKRIPERGAEPVHFAKQQHIMAFELNKTSMGWRVTLVGFVP